MSTPPPYEPETSPSPSGPPPYRPDASAASPAAPTSSRRALWIGLGAGAFVLAIVAVVFALQLAASSAYDAALDSWRDAIDETSAAQGDLSSAAAEGVDAAAIAQQIVAVASDGLVDTAARDAVAGAATALGQSAAAATDAADATLPDAAPARPAAFWDLFAAAGDLDADAAGLAAERRDLTDAADVVDTDTVALSDAADTLYLSADAAGPAFEAAHIDARNAEVIAFRDAKDTVFISSGVGADALDAMTAYSSAAQAVVASEQEELASISDGLSANRLAAQAFARSIDGGVLLEFDWAPLVFGFGDGGSIGGYTTWNYDHGGHAIMQLSDSVAELWPQDVTLNLVAHEVGHVISAKCRDLLNDQDQASIEAFATAWAIGMGYTGEGNGVSLYGQPSPELIASAATCR